MKIRMILLISLLGLLLACASRPETKPVAPEAPKPVPVKIAKEGWEAEWEKTLQAAKKEGTLTIVAATSIGPALREALPDFEKKYGIKHDLLVMRSAESSAKIFQERAAGLYTYDILMGGLNTAFGVFKPRGILAPLEPTLLHPEVVEPKLWFGEKLPWVDDDHFVFNWMPDASLDLVINTDLVNPKEIKSLHDLLDNKWKGKLVVRDPTISGTAFSSFASLVYHKVLDLDYFRQLVRQEPTVMRDMRIMMEWVAKGKFGIGLWHLKTHYLIFKRAGAPIVEHETREPLFLSAGARNIMLLDKAPHPNATKIFINWFLSKDAQIIVQNFMETQSSRADLPIEGLADIRQPDKKYLRSVSNIEKWVLEEQDNYYDLARQIFGPLIR